MKTELELFKEISSNPIPLELLKSIGLRKDDYPDLTLRYDGNDLEVMFLYNNGYDGLNAAYKSFNEVLKYYPELNK